MRIHEFDVPEPGDPKLEIKELTVAEDGDIKAQAAKLFPLNVMGATNHEAKLKRLGCIRGYGTLHVTQGDKVHDILAAMTVRGQAFCNLAIDKVHDVQDEEAKPFFRSQKTTEVA